MGLTDSYVSFKGLRTNIRWFSLKEQSFKKKKNRKMLSYNTM